MVKHSGGAASAPAAPAPADNIFAPAEAAAGPGTTGTPVTFNAHFVSLYDALKIALDAAGFKFRIKGNVVMVMPANMPVEDLETRSYSVLSTLMERLGMLRREMGPGARGAGGGGGEFTGMAPTADLGASQQQDLKEPFNQLGVQWPEGSSISYLASIGKVRVCNTAENLAIFEQVLQDLNVTPRQVEIEARFVEVSQNDLDSLGFDWKLNSPMTLLEGQNNPGALSSAGHPVDYLDITTPTTPYSITKGLRFLNSGALGASVNAADDVLSLRGVLDNLDVGMVLHMLSQRSNTDLLSAPKVVTKSGQEAVMKVVTEYIYPTEYTVQYPPANNANYGGDAPVIIPMVQPGSFETREVGVILQVVPEVSAEGQMINLTMNPQVVSEPIWKNYGTQIPDPNPNNPRSFIELPMEQPFFKVRSISTSVSIYNGATVVMGGMITETRTAAEDKVPFLGDIPWFGKFFRSSAEQAEKRNLLIFVTARLVDPAGRSLKTGVEPALAAGGAAAAASGTPAPRP